MLSHHAFQLRLLDKISKIDGKLNIIVSDQTNITERQYTDMEGNPTTDLQLRGWREKPPVPVDSEMWKENHMP